MYCGSYESSQSGLAAVLDLILLVGVFVASTTCGVLQQDMFGVGTAAVKHCNEGIATFPAIAKVGSRCFCCISLVGLSVKLYSYRLQALACYSTTGHVLVSSSDCFEVIYRQIILLCQGMAVQLGSVSLCRLWHYTEHVQLWTVQEELNKVAEFMV